MAVKTVYLSFKSQMGPALHGPYLFEADEIRALEEAFVAFQDDPTAPKAGTYICTFNNKFQKMVLNYSQIVYITIE